MLISKLPNALINQWNRIAYLKKKMDVTQTSVI